MRRKWVITGAVVILVVVAWVITQMNSNRGMYSAEKVDAMLSSYPSSESGGWVESWPEGAERRMNRVGLYVAGWKRRLGIKSTRYSQLYACRGFGNWTVVTVLIEDKNAEAVEIHTDHFPAPVAEKLRSRFSKEFPGLPCKIISD